MWSPSLRHEIQDMFDTLSVPELHGDETELPLILRRLSGGGQGRAATGPKERRERLLAAHKRYNDKRPEPTDELRARRRKIKADWLARRAA